MPLCLFVTDGRARLLAEQTEVQGGSLHPLDFDTVENVKLLDLCIRETLRLNPPLVTVMRQVSSSARSIEERGHSTHVSWTLFLAPFPLPPVPPPPSPLPPRPPSPASPFSRVPRSL